MRSRRRSREGGGQAEKQQRYVQLIGQGITNSQACRIVGINRKTGNRWRYGRWVANAAGEVLHYAPVKIVPAKPRRPALGRRPLPAVRRSSASRSAAPAAATPS